MTEPSLPQGWNMFSVSSSRQGTVGLWRTFAAAKWHNKHPWIVMERMQIFCLYCKTRTGLLSGSSVFVLTPFTDTQLNKSIQHGHSESHQAAAASYREGQQRLALGATILQTIQKADTLTVDEEGNGSHEEKENLQQPDYQLLVKPQLKLFC